MMTMLPAFAGYPSLTAKSVCRTNLQMADRDLLEQLSFADAWFPFCAMPLKATLIPKQPFSLCSDYPEVVEGRQSIHSPMFHRESLCLECSSIRRLMP
jgi:hypothetical protein